MALKYYRKQAPWNYWSNSKVAKWLHTKAGLDNPEYLSLEGWDNHRVECKEKARFVYWLTDTAFDKVQDVVYIVPNIFYSIGVFYKNWKCKSHTLHSDFPVGEWCDLSNRIPRCLFLSLEWFIEKEKGFKRLAWELSDELKEECRHQHDAAVEQKAIYDWWKANKDRDPFVESGMMAYYDRKLENGENLFGGKISKEWEELNKECSALEKQLKKEEEDMLIRLVKIRDSLWT